jgi:hypothetical protein
MSEIFFNLKLGLALRVRVRVGVRVGVSFVLARKKNARTER